jgi:hypothetical protein
VLDTLRLPPRGFFALFALFTVEYDKCGHNKLLIDYNPACLASASASPGQAKAVSGMTFGLALA